MYTYLGIGFSTKLSTCINNAANDIVNKAKKGVIEVLISLASVVQKAMSRPKAYLSPLYNYGSRSKTSAWSGHRFIIFQTRH